MRPLALRHPWMIIAPIAILLFFALSMYDTYRTPPVLCNLESNNFIREPIFAFPLLLEAIDLFRSNIKSDESESSNSLSARSDGHAQPGKEKDTFSWPADGDATVDMATAECETIRDFVNRNQKTLALIREAASKPTFVHYSELARVCVYTRNILNYQAHPSRNVLNDYYEVFSLYPVTMLTKANMLNAVLDQDVDAFIDAADIAFATAALPTKSLMFPDALLVNLDAYFILLNTMNWAVNHLSLDAAQLQQLRDILARDCSNKSAVISDAWRLRLVYAELAYEEATRQSYLPPAKFSFHWDSRYAMTDRRMPFEYGFKCLGDGWLSFDTLDQLNQLHQTRCAIEADSVAFYPGEHDYETTHQAIPAKHWMSAYGVKGRNYSQPYAKTNAATAIRDDLFDRQQVLWPHRKYYEPYPEILAHARALDAALAARQYLLDKGAFPDTLEKLVPDYMKALPLDPYGFHQPLKYENHEHYIELSSLCQTRLFDKKLPEGIQRKRHTAQTNNRFNGVIVLDNPIQENPS